MNWKTETFSDIFSNNPRMITTNIFGRNETYFLLYALLAAVMSQFLFFIASSVSRPQITDQYDLNSMMAVGYFQTISTRNAGFVMMDDGFEINEPGDARSLHGDDVFGRCSIYRHLILD